MTHNTRHVLLWTLLTGLITALIACGLAYAVINKVFVTWRPLPAAPQPARVLAGATVDSVDIEVENGVILRCNPDEEESCWEQVAEPLTETDEGCEPFARSRPLNRASDTLLVCQNYADGGFTAQYALRDGRVFAWRAGDSAYEVFLLLACPAAGGIVGLLAGLVVGLLTRRKTA